MNYLMVVMCMIVVENRYDSVIETQAIIADTVEEQNPIRQETHGFTCLDKDGNETIIAGRNALLSGQNDTVKVKESQEYALEGNIYLRTSKMRKISLL